METTKLAGVAWVTVVVVTRPTAFPASLAAAKKGLRGVPSAWMARPPFTVFTPQERAFPAALDSVT